MIDTFLLLLLVILSAWRQRPAAPVLAPVARRPRCILEG